MIMRTVLFCWPALFRNFFCFGMFLTNHVGLFAWNVFFMEWWRACSCSEISSQGWGRGGTGPNGSIVIAELVVACGSRVVIVKQDTPSRPSEAKMLVMVHYCRRCADRHVVLMVLMVHLPYPWGQQSKLGLSLAHTVLMVEFSNVGARIYTWNCPSPSPLSLVCLSSQRLKTLKTPTPHHNSIQKNLAVILSRYFTSCVT
jgi:hypothetical protein